MTNRYKHSESWIYQQVFGAILEQRLLPGTKLTEQELCDIFDVSRTIVRKVLLRLSLERVVDLRPNRGAVIAEPMSDDVREIFEARRVLEDAIVAEACRKFDAKDEAALRDIVDREHACANSNDKSGAIRLSGEFHMRLADIAGNRPLRELLRQLVAQTSLAIARYQPPGRTLCADDDHTRLLAALRDRDVALCQALMRGHLTHCEQQLQVTQEEPANDLRRVFADVLGRRRSA